MNSNGSQEKNLKHKSYLMRSEGRADYKVERSRVLDFIAAVVSVALAVLFWVISSGEIGRASCRERVYQWV